MNSATTPALKTARCSAKSNNAVTVSESKTNLTNVNAPMWVIKSRVSFAGCQSNTFVILLINNANYMCSLNAIYSTAPNATSTYPHMIGLSECPLNHVSQNENIRFPVANNNQPYPYPNQSYNQPDSKYLLLPLPGFEPLPQCRRQLSHDELFLPRPEFMKFNSNPL